MDEPAFPIRGADGTMYDLGFINATAGKYASGLTKRELFAAMALQGYIIASNTVDPDEAGDFALVAADSLIDALNASKGEG